jgi:DNA-damage-inducible protein I
MRIEITLDKTRPLPDGALPALCQELTHRIDKYFPELDNSVKVRYASSNNLSVFNGSKEDKSKIEEILQETWESADDWFTGE